MIDLSDPDIEVLSRIRSLLGEDAVRSFVPLFRKWVSRGFIGGPGFNDAGDRILAACRELGGLQSGHCVLDVGCGIGRNTLPLLMYLEAPGSYEGFDMVASGVKWLRTHVTPGFPRFRFRKAIGISSALYNPDGGRSASRYTFPYKNRGFDFAIAVSVFTHMTPDPVIRYLSEISRTLKRGGKLLCTAYLLDADAVQMVTSQRSAIAFPYDFRTYRLRSISVPESAVAFDETYFLQCAKAAGLYLKGGIQRGSWRQTQSAMTSQDLIILEKGTD